jgi:ppGpp synthetase/RelA/SpoT-type nucleotidyltranferase
MGNKERQSSSDLSALEQEYKSTAPIAENFCIELTNQINRLVEDQGITLGFPIQFRVKQWESLVEKLERLGLEMTSVKGLQDFVGLRLVLLFGRDVEKVCDLLSNNFEVIRQYNTQDRLAENQFGYSSKHFIVELPKQWLAVPTLARFAGLQAEIQVRTVAQHMWAAASHTLQYKQEASVPPAVRRAIYRASALLETVDLEFERVLEQREIYRDSVDIIETKDELNVDLLSKTLDELLPQENRHVDEPYAALLKELQALGINTAQSLRELINEDLKETLLIDSNRVKQEQARLASGKTVLGATPERVQSGVFYTHAGLIRKMLLHRFGEKFKIVRSKRKPAAQQRHAPDRE